MLKSDISYLTESEIIINLMILEIALFNSCNKADKSTLYPARYPGKSLTDFMLRRDVPTIFFRRASPNLDYPGK